MTSRHRSANERTSATVARIAGRILMMAEHVRLSEVRLCNKPQCSVVGHFIPMDDIRALAASCLTQTADKASTPRHRRPFRAPATAKKAGTKSRGKGAKPLGHYTPRKIELRKRR